MKKPAVRSVYSVHPSVATVQNWRASLGAKTGRTLEEWVALVRAEGPPDEAGRRAWLKREHRLGTNSAVWIAERCEGKGGEADEPEAYLRAAAGWVDAMLMGKRAHLRPLYDRLLRLGLGLGDDVRACPCETTVPLYRRHVFAQIKPATNTRIDLGLALGEVPASGRLIDTGGFARKDRITHRIPLSPADELDDEVTDWLRRAYEADAAD